MNKIRCAFYGAGCGLGVGICLWFCQCACAIISCSDTDGSAILFGIIFCTIIGTLIGLCVGLYEDEEEKKREQIDRIRREHEENARKRQEELDREAAERKRKAEATLRRIQQYERDVEDSFKQIYKKIACKEKTYDFNLAYESVFRLREQSYKENNIYKEKFETNFNDHLRHLNDNVRLCCFGLNMAVVNNAINSLNCLKIFNGDIYNSTIETLEKTYNSISQTTNYIKFDSYGNCIFPLDNAEEREYLDSNIEMIEQKLKCSLKHVNDNETGYFEGIINNLTSNFINEASRLMWYYANKKPFDVEKFEKAKELYDTYRINKLFIKNENNEYKELRLIKEHIYYIRNIKEKEDLVEIERIEKVLASIYAKNQVGGINAVKQDMKYVNFWIDRNIELKCTEECYTLASGLAWMDLYTIERDVLQKLVASGVQLTAEIQDRLRFLESGGTADVKIYQVEPTDEFIYDSSSSEWKAKEFDVFFRKIAMKNIKLNYSLAISKWTKTLPLASGQKVSQDSIYNEFLKMTEDFDGEVSCNRKTVRAVNLANLEYKNAAVFKFNSNRNRCISVIFSSEKYGRNLNITIITMFTPESGLEPEELKKYALAIKDNIYVESFRESILQAVDEVIKIKQTVYDDDEPIVKKKIFE